MDPWAKGRDLQFLFLNHKLNLLLLYFNYINNMLELPEVIHTILHDFLKLPSSITITNQDIKDNSLFSFHLVPAMAIHDRWSEC